MENQNVPPIKSNNPAPTVEQINADKITQVPIADYHLADVYGLLKMSYLNFCNQANFTLILAVVLYILMLRILCYVPNFVAK